VTRVSLPLEVTDDFLAATEEAGRAIGVEYQHEGLSYFAGATKEVIVSAGALASPKLLMFSGISAANHLRGHGIDVAVDAPAVGTNLQDHAYGLMMYTTTAEHTRRGIQAVEGTQPWCQLPGAAQGRVDDVRLRRGRVRPAHGYTSDRAEIILMPVGMSSTNAEGEDRAEHGTRDMKLLPHGMILYPIYVHPTARGTVRLASRDPSAPARARARARARAGDEVQTDEQWAAHLRTTAFRPYHLTGTCRMGSDDGSVVDAELRVRGTR
jgi:choline dehydrogenase-like flavoprotein